MALQIVASGISMRYGRRQVLSNVSFTVGAGEILGLLGHNGAGKTTLLAILSGMERATEGAVVFRDKRQSVPCPEAQLGCILGRPGFYPNHSAMRNLLIFGYMRGLSGVAFKARCLALMTEFGLEGEERKKVGEYSDGMRQRLALLRCVLHEPKVLILDEPTEGMDPVGVRFVRAFLYQQSRVQGRTVILSSHLLGEIEETCDSILLLRKGQVQLHEATSRLLSRLDLDYTLSVSDPKSALAALREKAYAEARIVGTQIRLSCRREMVARLVAALTSQGIEVYDVARTTSGLEALFQGDATCSATCLGS